MVALDLTRPVLGTMNFGDTVTAEVAANIMDAAIAAGVTHVDTANGYAGGATEEILAGLLACRRDQVTIATKAGIPHPDAGDHAPLSAPGLRASLEGSLRRLGVDSVDLFYLHQPDRQTPLSETLVTIAELVKEGKIGALGVSNYAAWQIAELNHLADDTGAPRPVVAQQVYNLLARRLEDEYAEFAAESGLVTMVYNPLGGGLLTGRHTFDDQPSDGRFGDSRLATMYKQRYWNTAIFEAVERLTTLAGEVGLAMTEMALRWLVSKPASGPILLGASKIGHLESNIAAIEAGPLDDDVVSACDDIGATLRGAMPNYNR